MAIHTQPKNHLLRLAQPLFWLLDELSPELESAARLDALKTEVRTRLAAFKQAAQAAALKADSIEAVHYCFCAALDQAGSRVHGRTDGLRGVWLQHGLLMQFYGEKTFGLRCRRWITRLQETPNTSENALEVIAQLMERGLRDERGMPLPNILLVRQHGLAVVPNLDAEHPPRQMTVSNAFAEPQRIHVAVIKPATGAVEAPELLISVGVPAVEVPPVQEQHPQHRWRIPVIVLMVAALVASLAVALYRQHLDNQALASQVDALSMQTAKQQEPLASRISRALELEGAAGSVGLSAEGDRIYLVFSSDLGFAVGSSDITSTFARQLDRLATVLADTGGTVKVVGHTDDSPGRPGRPETNLALSAARAMSVGRHLQAHGIAPSRMSIQGRGAKDPVGDNRTTAGKALNRRVEIVIEKAS